MAKMKCLVCGQIFEGDVCPVCGAKGDKIVPYVEEEMTWADEHVLGVAKGVDSEILEGLRNHFKGECSEVGMYLAMARQAFREGYPEVALVLEQIAKEEAEHAARFAEMLGELVSNSTKENLEKLENYIKTKQWWDTIDCFDRIIGDIGLKDTRVAILMLKWSQDDDFWLRRIAIDHQLLRKDQTDQHLLEKIIVNNLNSDEFFINKAIGWSLRDYSKTDPEWVRNFIEKYRDKMSSLSIKEASKYL